MEISEVKTVSLKKINKINKALITFSKEKKRVKPEIINIVDATDIKL